MDEGAEDGSREALRAFVWEEPEVARILRQVLGTKPYGAPAQHRQDQMLAALRDMITAVRIGDRAAALDYLKLFAQMMADG